MRHNSLIGRMVIACALFSATMTAVSADWNSFWEKVHIGKRRNNAWPDPFNEMDAMSVIAPFEVMKQNGWVLHNTIGADHFRDGDGALKPSGRASVAWIATQAPLNRRQIYIVRGANPEETSARIEAVQTTLSETQINGPVPTVAVVDRTVPTFSGARAVKIQRMALERMAAPRLPSASSSGTMSAAQ